MLVAVPNRALLRVAGVDAVSFLQGMTTANVERWFLHDRSSRSLFTGFLSPQGRVLYESIIHCPGSGDDEVMVECDTANLDSMLTHLKRYRLRSRIHLDPCPDLRIIQSTGDACGTPDPRCSDMGYRYISTSLEARSRLDTATDSLKTYRRLRYQVGVAEGHAELPPSARLPQEFNFDYMNGIDYRKGCYIGQELTIRTHHRGVVRKRVVPIRLQSSDSTCPLNIGGGDSLRLEGSCQRKPEGEVVAWDGEWGLALVRLDSFKLESCQLIAANGTRVTAILPKWWPTLSAS